ITSDADEYAAQVNEKLTAAGLRTALDIRNEKINYKVREHSLAKVPVIFVLGKREAEEGTVSIRRLGQKEQESLALDLALDKLSTQAAPPVPL
ncbi:MAG: His/Gly/Thr/Pro-type tRNA ligase C-terminal domain-containing protein, partial [Alphaproteobacteria bacterium]